MKRTGIDIEWVAAYPNLAAAAAKASRGKRTRPEVQAFFSRLDMSLNRLGAHIRRGEVPLGGFRSFVIHDPKARTIHAAPFVDRVLHHALMNHAGPVLERGMVDTTFACRPGKGIHKAVAVVQRNLRRFPWYVKIDIERYFDSIDHARLMALLARRFKGPAFLDVLRKVIAAFESGAGRGLPIGSLTSQYFANYYLDGLDRFVVETMKAAAHVRYMDDVVFWTRSKAEAKAILAETDDYAQCERGLRLKPEATQVNRSGRGITFCGFRVLPGQVRIGRRRKRRYGALRRSWEEQYIAGCIGASGLQAGYAGVHAMTLHAETRQWRREQLRRYPAVDA